LQKAGFKVGAHFSPYVSVATEKIQINNKLISMKEFVDLVEEVKPIIQKCHETFDTPSYFEVWHMMAFLYFKKKKCNYVVQETGCGGRYDGSNAVRKTLVSVITNIGLDHTHILGNSIKKIAFEKAGIIRKHGKVFTAVKKPVALKIIQDECDKLGADLTIVESGKKTRKQEINKTNQLVAIAVAQHLHIKDKKIKLGLTETNPIPARFEIVKKNPTVIIDGAHNPDKIAYLTQKIKKSIKQKNKLHLICGLTQHKKPKDCFKELIKLTDYVYATRPTLGFRKVLDPVVIARDLKAIAPGLKTGVRCRVFLDPQKALEEALKKAGKDDLILITGSFFLCSDLRKNWISEEKQLEQRTNFPK